IEALPELPLFIVGNEIFDALPVRQYVLTPSGWRERLVGLDDAGRLIFLAGPGSIDPALLPPDLAEPGTIFEIAPAREAMAAGIASRIVASGGAGLFFDYGHLHPGYGDTLQAVRNHRFTGVFDQPGEADLTSHVDFSALGDACRRAGAGVSFLDQGDFLARMGLPARAERLARSHPAEAARIAAAAERLAGDSGMGRLFKVMAIHGETVPYPFGQ